MRALAQPAVSDRGTRGAGRGRRHDAARGAAGRAAHLSAWRVHSRHELYRHSRPGRAAAGAYPGRLDGGVRQLALDLLDQCARGTDRAVGHLALVHAQRARARAPL
ncbi:hypothetical protein SDC9_154597 [bioreactor metagenome]|uniref:Uncharacterized protein n=1 Tax=bioreactor metagenome TaxID=1076179 RepID=A0A645EZ70_9ZZZZ